MCFCSYPSVLCSSTYLVRANGTAKQHNTRMASRGCWASRGLAGPRGAAGAQQHASRPRRRVGRRSACPSPWQRQRLRLILGMDLRARAQKEVKKTFLRSACRFLFLVPPPKGGTKNIKDNGPSPAARTSGATPQRSGFGAPCACSGAVGRTESPPQVGGRWTDAKAEGNPPCGVCASTSGGGWGGRGRMRSRIGGIDETTP